MKKKRTGLRFPQESMAKILLKMKLLTVLMLAFVAVSAANNTYSQATKFNLKLNGVTVKQVFNEIEEKSEFILLYNETDVDVNRRVDVKVKGESVETVLNQIFEGTQNAWQIYDRQIVILEDEKAEIPAILKQKADQVGSVHAQQKEITGKVTDTDGLPMPGVSIIVKGTTIGTVTNGSGEFSLSIPISAEVLQFSFVGMKTQEIEVGAQTTINVTMETAAIGIEEVIAVGYGSMKKSDLTGAVVSVGTEDLVAYPATNAIQALQGRAAGVSVQSTNGEPGGDYKITIRGATSINASSNPLFVVDGLVGGVLPPAEDIASIEVLKDASASAIYGSRGANGVVLVTTKKGLSGKTSVKINSSYSFQQDINRIEVLGARDFAEYINEARGTDFYDLNALEADTDWQELILRNGHIQNHQLSVSGGSEKVKYYLSGIYFDQKGVIETSEYDRMTLTSNLDFNVSDHVQITMNSMLQRSNQTGVQTQTSGGLSNAGATTSALTFEPVVGIKDDEGNYNDSRIGIAAIDNPVAILHGQDREVRNENMQTNIKGEFILAKGFIFNSTFGMIIRNRRNGLYHNRISNVGESNNGLGTMDYRRNYNFLTEQYINYDLDINEKNSFILTAGYSYQSFKMERFSATNAGFISDAMSYWNLEAGSNLQPPDSRYSASEIASLYGRMNYNFDERYLITATGRYDGASRFSEGNKWSFFPSGAFSWNISNESFYPENAVLSALKLRTSYGLTGNQAIAAYESLARISTTYFILNDHVVNSVRPTAIANKDLTWETTSQFNIGLDFGFLERRINLTSEYYYKKTHDLLFEVPIPAFSGYESRLENIGELENKGFEFQLISNNLVNALKWTTNFNLTLNENKVLKLPKGEDIIYSGAPGYMVSGGTLENAILREGEPVGSFYGYVYEGVYQEGDTFIPGGAFETEPGGEKFADLNNDEELNSDDRTIIGNPNPDAVWGLNNDLSWKGLSLNVFVQAYTGGDMLNFTKMELDRLNGNSNATIDALNRWTPQNTDTDVPKATSGRVSRSSTRFVEDGSYVRLKNLSLGYDLPQNWLNSLNIHAAHLYVSGQNLFTITNYSGVDPEVAYRSNNLNRGLDYGSYPLTNSYTVGLKLEF